MSVKILNWRETRKCCHQNEWVTSLKMKPGFHFKPRTEISWMPKSNPTAPLLSFTWVSPRCSSCWRRGVAAESSSSRRWWRWRPGGWPGWPGLPRSRPRCRLMPYMTTRTLIHTHAHLHSRSWKRSPQPVWDAMMKNPCDSNGFDMPTVLNLRLWTPFVNSPQHDPLPQIFYDKQ